MHFIFEDNATPIYQRIIDAMANALTQAGHQVLRLKRTDYVDAHQYVNLIRNHPATHLVITNSTSPLSFYWERYKSFVFELIEKRLVFVHHDSIVGHLDGQAAIKERLEAFQRVNDKSAHFCIEYSNYLDLKAFGIVNAHYISHGSEFRKATAAVRPIRSVAFVGHILPPAGNYFSEYPEAHKLHSDFWNRVNALDTKLEISADFHADQTFPNKKYGSDWLSAKYRYVAMINANGISPHFKGEIVSRVGEFDIDIYGGDPAYLHAEWKHLPPRKIEKRGLTYHAATGNYADTQDVYAKSKINLNITSLQFDDAVNNRVIDIGGAGGFVLTDYKSALRTITSVHSEISFHTIDEMNNKIEYYLTHEKERLEIAEELHRNVVENCNYEAIVERIISRISPHMNENTTPLRLDLGCGPRKQPGFIGVDLDDKWPSVDVAADLTKRFPYPDSSVDEIRAHDIIEHLPDRIHTMNELWRICKPGARVDLCVPSTDGRGAFQDPTHISFWNINSFYYYCAEFPAYLELCRSYGFKGQFKIIYINQKQSNDRVVHVMAILEVVK